MTQRLAANVGHYAPTGGGFHPSDVAGLQFLLDSYTGVLEGVSDPAEHGDAAVTWSDQSVAGNHFAINSSTYQIPGSGSPYLSLGNASMPAVTRTGNPMSGQTGSVFLCFNAMSDGQFITIFDLASRYAAVCQSSGTPFNSNAGTPSIYLNDTLVTTRAGLYGAALGGGIVVLSAIGIDMTSWANIGFFGFTSGDWGMIGRLYGAIGYTGAKTDDRANIKNWLAGRYS